MKIGLIGWYGHANAGDERILYCLRRFLSPHELVVTASLDDAAARLAELDACDFVLLGGGGLVLRRTGVFAPFIERLKPRFGCVGISIEARHADNRALLDVLKERSEFILVRDDRSRDLLECHFKTIVAPDLTFLYPYDIAPPVTADVCGLNLRPWAFWRGEYSGWFDLRMRRLERRLPSLERFYPLQKWTPLKAVRILQGACAEVIPVPLYSEPGRPNDVTTLGDYFPAVPTDFSPELIGRCRLLVSMRLHGLMFACQMGVPFISLSYQPKNEEFVARCGSAGLAVPLYGLEPLGEAVEAAKQGYEGIRAALLDVRADSQREITAVMTALRRLIEGERS